MAVCGRYHDSAVIAHTVKEYRFILYIRIVFRLREHGDNEINVSGSLCVAYEETLTVGYLDVDSIETA